MKRPMTSMQEKESPRKGVYLSTQKQKQVPMMETPVPAELNIRIHRGPFNMQCCSTKSVHEIEIQVNKALQIHQIFT